MKYFYVFLFILVSLTVKPASCITTIVVNLDSNQLKILNSNPVQVIPQPPTNYFTEILKVKVDYTAGTVAYPIPYNTLYFYYGDTTHTTHFSLALMGGSSLTTSTENLNDYELLANSAVFIKMLDHNPAQGNGSVKVYLTYRYVRTDGTTDCQPETDSTGSVCTEIIHLTQTQILNLNTTPQVILPAPSPDRYIKLLGADCKRDTGTAYTTNINMLLYYTDSTKFSGTNNQSLGDSTSVLRSFAIGANGAILNAGQPLKITTQNGNPSGGTNGVDLLITYMTISVDSNECFGGVQVRNLPYAKDSIGNLLLDTVYLQLNTENLIVAQGSTQNIVYVFPQGADGDVIKITNTQGIINAIPDGVGISTLTPRRISELISETEVTFRWAQSGWY